MSRKKYIPVGGILTRKSGKYYEVAAQSTCTGCAFRGKKNCSPAQCVGYTREDKTSVIFIRRKDLEVKPVEVDRPFKKDDPVMVRNIPTNEWSKRYYSHKEDEKHYCFSDGATSWSNQCLALSGWLECRHPTEEELK